MRNIFNTQKVKLVFSYDYYIGISTSNAYQSFDIMKYKKIRDRLIKEKLIRRKHILIPEMVSYEDMVLVHDEDYLTKIKDPLKVAQLLRIGEVDPWDSYILEFFRTVTGGTILAAEHVIKRGGVVFNLGGGFHHAQRDRAAGFCLINDVAITIEKVRLKYDLSRILIIDLDYHQGDGNLEFFRDNSDVFTFSMHATKWIEAEKERNIDILLPHHVSGSEYMNILRSTIEPIFNSFDPELVIYIAGSDPYEHDTLCDLNLSREEMLERNLYVTNLVKNRKLPMVVVAGGGYGAESWKIYYDFIATTINGKNHDFLT
jgi:acetoin utilization deacetylase AcuC-like enzyme